MGRRRGRGGPRHRSGLRRQSRGRNWRGLLVTCLIFAAGGVLIWGVLSAGAGAHNATTPADYESEATERHFIEFLNEERTDRGLQKVHEAEKLDEIADGHAQNMATHDYIGHEQPNGDNIRDRYREAGLLEECKLESGDGSYYAGTENAGGSYWDQTLDAKWAEGGSFSVRSNRDLAKYLFEAWMHSEGHREAMLVHSADEMALGLAITEEEKVFAALELC